MRFLPNKQKYERFSDKENINSYKTEDTTILSLISKLKDSKTISVAYHANNPEIGLSAYKDLNLFKLYMAGYQACL